jgi:hypothetical protein
MAGGESSYSAAVPGHAGEDRDAAAAGRIKWARSGANFDDDAGDEEVLRKAVEKAASPVAGSPPDAQRVSPCSAGNHAEQNGITSCRGKPLNLLINGSVGIEKSKRKFRLVLSGGGAGGMDEDAIRC